MSKMSYFPYAYIVIFRPQIVKPNELCKSGKSISFKYDLLATSLVTFYLVCINPSFGQVSGQHPDSRYIGCSEGIFQIHILYVYRVEKSKLQFKTEPFFVSPCSILDIGMTPMEPIAE